MKTSIRAVSALAVLLLLAAPAWAGVAVGDPPPDHLGRSHQGNDVRVSAFHGKVVVVTFWAS